jgi:2-oxoglutarate dehydrogenase complex dehydrogenase (E1) component-like enzyme
MRADRLGIHACAGPRAAQLAAAAAGRRQLARRASVEEKKLILNHLTEAEGFEAFCQKRYVGTKRFGLEGEDVTIPALHALIDQVAKDGVRTVAIGMPHRGRLNTLVNIVQAYTAIFSEFAGASFKPDDVRGSGDVKYHLGTSTDVDIDGNPVHLAPAQPVASGSRRSRGDRQGARGPGR